MAADMWAVSREWAARPADERFSSLAELVTAAEARKVISKEFITKTDRLEVGHRVDSATPGDPGEVVIRDGGGHEWLLSHHAFGQLAQRTGGHAACLRGLPAPLAGMELAWRASQCDVSYQKVLTLGAAGEPASRIRAFTSEQYQRVYDADVARSVAGIVEDAGKLGRGEWGIPVPFNGGGTGPAAVQVADQKDSTLFLGDQSMFVTIVNPDYGFDAPGGGIMRAGLIFDNSEVGTRALGVKRFLYDFFCSNYSIRGMSQYEEIRLRHVGAVASRLRYDVIPQLRSWMLKGLGEDERLITAAASKEVAKGAKEAEAFLVARKFSVDAAKFAVRYAETRPGMNPMSVWGMVSGLTAYNRDHFANADARFEADKAAGKLYDLVRV